MEPCDHIEIWGGMKGGGGEGGVVFKVAWRFTWVWFMARHLEMLEEF